MCYIELRQGQLKEVPLAETAGDSVNSLRPLRETSLPQQEGADRSPHKSERQDLAAEDILGHLTPAAGLCCQAIEVYANSAFEGSWICQFDKSHTNNVPSR